jgi:signal transduction histidine kinase
MQNTIASAEFRRPGLKTVLGAWFEARTWVCLAHISVGMVISTVTFVVVITAVSLSLGLLIVVIGFPLLAITLGLTQALGGLERGRYGLLLDEDIASPHVPANGNAWAWFKKRVLSAASWKELLWFLLTVVVTATSWSLAMMALQFYGGRIQNTNRFVQQYAQGTGGRLLLAIVGLVCFLLVPWIARGWVALDATMAHFFLGPNEKTKALETRVENLTVTRAASVDAADAERRRIERDLHDGAQQRLVALAMSLGMASDKMDSEPEVAKAMVAEAHQEAKKAVAELRDLARGIHPVSLSDRGLAGALPGLAARCPIPVEVSIDIVDRPLPTVEGIAYFVVSECLTNMAKHANATKGWVSARRIGDRLVLEVRDNGIGGATIKAGGGLRGLQDRVASIDGTLSVFSAPAGSTTVTATLPCQPSNAPWPAPGGAQ